MANKKLIHIIFFIATCLMFCYKPLYSQHTVNFSADKTNGCTPLIVQFYNLSSGFNSPSYFWEFGNGNTSSLEHPQTIYTQHGNYTVKLTITDNSGTYAEEKLNFIIVNENPQANFSVLDDSIGCIPFNASFIDNSIPGSSSINSRIWYFGDGDSSYNANPHHLYQLSGNYNVTLKVADANGCQNQKTKISLIEGLPLPNVDFNVNENLTCLDTLSALFANNTPGNITHFLWDFGNGYTSSLANPSTFYSGEGSYNVRLEATDDSGCIGILIKEDYINLINIHADFSLFKDTFCLGEEINIVNNSSALASYYWEFGDGSTSTETNPSIIYNAAGSYTIKLFANYNGSCIDSLSKTVHIEEAIANFSTDKDYICQLPVTINYNNLSSNATSYEWKFHNNTSSAFPNPSVFYDSTSNIPIGESTFIIDTLIATSEHGCVDTAIKNNLVEFNIPLTSFIFTSDPFGCVPVEISIDNNSYYNSSVDSIINYKWELGNGDTSNLIEPYFVYNKPGEYDVKLTTITALGCRNYHIKEAIAGTKQSPDFQLLSSDTTCAVNSLILKNTSTDTNLINRWFWQFSDASIYTEFEPEVYIVDTGHIHAALYAIYNGCISDPMIKENFVYVKGPIGIFQPFNSCAQPYRYLFIGKIIDADEFLWSFGDGAIDSTSHAPYHEYSIKDDYNVTLYSVNHDNGCGGYTLIKEINIRIPKAVIELSKPNICLGDTLEFIATNSIDASASKFGDEYGKYKWVFGDGNELVTSMDTVQYLYDSIGNFNVTLIIEDTNECYDTAVYRLKVSSPKAYFTSDYPIGCTPFTVNFQDSSTVDTTYSTTWHFGDGNSIVGSNVQNTYVSNGIYPVKILIEDAIGCKDSIEKINYIETSRPQIGFTAVDTTQCFGDTTLFTNSSQGIELAYVWDFGDGDTSLLQEPSHSYNESGNYSVSLMAIDKNNCSANLERTGYISIQNLPIANFNIDDSTFDCYPAMISLQDSSISEDIITWGWNFGDSTGGSNMQNPFHIYAKPGLFNVSLNVITDFGCQDSIVKTNLIEVNGPYANIIAPDSACFKNLTHFELSNQLNINTLIWDMDDGSVYNTSQIDHLYQSSGYFHPKLYLFADSANTCDKIFQDTIFISEVAPDFEVPELGLCIDTNIYFKNTSAIKELANWYVNNNLVSADTNLTYKFTTSNQYEIKLLASNSLGCADSTAKHIYVNNLPIIETHADTSLCLNDSINLWAKANGGIKYQWNYHSCINNINIPNPIATPDTSTNFTVKVIDTNRCKNNKSVFVKVLPLPELSFNNDTNIVVGEIVELSALSAPQNKIAYYPISWVVDSSLNTISVKPEANTTYYAKATDMKGCTRISSVNIEVNNSYSVNLPDYFTPNGDGINDEIFVKGWGIKELIYFEVYNEWGQKIFASHSIDQGWDGKINGEKAKSGTYAYKLKVEFYNDKSIEKSGVFSIVK